MSSDEKLSEREWFAGWMRLVQLQEQVSPVRMGDAYLWKEQAMQEVQRQMLEMAPQGVHSQGEYIDIMEKALKAVDENLRNKITDEGMMADIELTLSMIERTLRMIPHQVFFAQMAQTSQEE